MLNERTVGGCLWMFLGAFIAAEAFRLGLGTFGRPGPGFVAFGAAILMAAQGAALLLEGTVGVGKLSEECLRGREERHWGPPLLTVLALFLYVALMPELGFAVASFLFLAGMLLAPAGRNWIRNIALAAATVVLSYLVFVTLLKVRMPAGFLGFG